MPERWREEGNVFREISTTYWVQGQPGLLQEILSEKHPPTHTPPQKKGKKTYWKKMLRQLLSWPFDLSAMWFGKAVFPSCRIKGLYLMAPTLPYCLVNILRNLGISVPDSNPDITKLGKIKFVLQKEGTNVWPSTDCLAPWILGDRKIKYLLSESFWCWGGTQEHMLLRMCSIADLQPQPRFSLENIFRQPEMYRDYCHNFLTYS